MLVLPLIKLTLLFGDKMNRIRNILLGLDESANSLFGGRYRETISGTIGRALGEAPAPIWARAARWAVDGILGQGHCVFNAKAEQDRRDALASLPENER